MNRHQFENSGKTLPTSPLHRLMIHLSILASVTIAIGCESASSDAPTLSIQYDSTNAALNISMPEEDDVHVMDCTDYLKVFKIEGASRTLLGKSAIGDDLWNGYFLDGVFVPPIAGMGCDVLSCVLLSERNRSLDLNQYSLEGVHTLTDAEKEAAAPSYEGTPRNGKAPNTLNEYTAGPYTGPVEVELVYSLNSECNNDEATMETLVQSFTVE